MNNIGIKVKNRREELMMTQEELARLTGYKHKSSINKIEAGLRDIPRKNINRFAEALNISVEWLICDESTMSSDDADFIKSLPLLHPKQELPPELEAINILLKAAGKQIIKVDGNYFFDECGMLTAEEVNELLNSVVLSVKNAADALIARKTQEIIKVFISKK